MLPAHGRIDCAICHRGQAYKFDETRTVADGWRITANPMAWGNDEPEVVVLGFSKGPSQAGDLKQLRHDDIAFRKGRTNLAKILHYIELLDAPEARLVDQAISSRTGRFHFGSLIRCTVERYDPRKSAWSGTGGGMLDRFVATSFGKGVVATCSTRFLRDLPASAKLVVMLGLGSKNGYVRAARSALSAARAGSWKTINEVAYTDGRIVVVHTEHFAAQGPLLPNWLSGSLHERGRFGLQAREAVRLALGS
ncbi:MAG: hypothetical protein ACK5YI_06325 [Rhodospirillales bacterium]|jgi:hypothetical protein